MEPMLPLHWPPATGGYREVSPPVGVQENFYILGAKWRILRPFSGAYLSLLKVLGEQILEKS